MKEEWKRNYEKFMEANKKSTITVNWTREDKINHIKRCEKVYCQTTTSEMVSKLEKNGFEGSPEVRRWVKYARELGIKHIKSESLLLYPE